MAKIENTNVCNLPESIFASGYPMRDKAPDQTAFRGGVRELMYETAFPMECELSSHTKRAIKLSQAKGGGHDQFLTGITVNFDLTMSLKAWVEAERYTFLNFVSSMSTMHRIQEMDIRDCCNVYVSHVVIDFLEELQCDLRGIDPQTHPVEYRDAFLVLLYNLPSGFELTAHMVTNYRCLKNIYAQRRNHTLPDWDVVCDWIEKLPMAKYLLCGETYENTCCL